MDLKRSTILKQIGVTLLVVTVMTSVGDCRPQLMTKNADVQRLASGTGSAKCRECSSDINRPLCGTDGRTYANECELERINCGGLSVEVRHEGRCTTAASHTAQGRCFSQRTEAERKLKQSNSRLNGGGGGGGDIIHVPQCQRDGTFNEVQCHSNTNYCWCVEPVSGQPVPGSSTVRSRRPKCSSSSSSTANNQLHTRDGLKANSKRGNAGKKRPVRQDCRKTEQTSFNRNLVKIFVSEYSRTSSASSDSPLGGGRSPAGVDTDPLERRAVDWKFFELDKNGNKYLEKKEVKSLRKMVRKMVKPSECAKKFTRLCDKNKDRIITKDEWTVCIGVDNKEQHDVSGLINPRHGGPLLEPDEPSSNVKGSPNVRPSVVDSGGDLEEEDPQDCFTERQNALEQQRSSQQTVYIPECDSDRKYSQIQCYKSTEICWCVNRDTGMPINRTSVRNMKPDCDKLIKADKQIKGCPSRKKHEFVMEFVDYLLREMNSATNQTSNAETTTTTTTTREKQLETLTRWKFDSLDTNLNKVLDKGEWREFRKELKKKKSVRKCGRNFIKMCDDNNDKKITYDEWVECFSIIKERKMDIPKKRIKGQNPLDKYLKND